MEDWLKKWQVQKPWGRSVSKVPQEQQECLSGVNDRESLGVKVRQVRGTDHLGICQLWLGLWLLLYVRWEVIGGFWTKERHLYWECLLIFGAKDQYILSQISKPAGCCCYYEKKVRALSVVRGSADERETCWSQHSPLMHVYHQQHISTLCLLFPQIISEVQLRPSTKKALLNLHFLIPLIPNVLLKSNFV